MREMTFLISRSWPRPGDVQPVAAQLEVARVEDHRAVLRLAARNEVGHEDEVLVGRLLLRLDLQKQDGLALGLEPVRQRAVHLAVEFRVRQQAAAGVGAPGELALVAEAGAARADQVLAHPAVVSVDALRLEDLRVEPVARPLELLESHATVRVLAVDEHVEAHVGLVGEKVIVKPGGHLLGEPPLRHPLQEVPWAAGEQVPPRERVEYAGRRLHDLHKVARQRERQRRSGSCRGRTCRGTCSSSRGGRGRSRRGAGQ